MPWRLMEDGSGSYWEDEPGTQPAQPAQPAPPVQSSYPVTSYYRDPTPQPYDRAPSEEERRAQESIIHDYYAPQYEASRQEEAAIIQGGQYQSESRTMEQQRLEHDREIARRNFALDQARIDVERSSVERQRGFREREYNLAVSSLGVGEQALYRQRDLAGRLQDLSRQRYSLDFAALSRVYGVEVTDDGFAQQLHGYRLGDIIQGYRLALREMQSQATVRGAIVTQGFRVDIAEAKEKFNRDYASANLERRREVLRYIERLNTINDEKARLGLTQQESELRYGEELAQINDRLSLLQIDSARARLGYDEALAELGDRDAMLNILSQDLGLRREDLEYQVNWAIQRLGLQGKVDDLTVMRQLLANRVGRYGIYSREAQDVADLIASQQ